MKKYYQIVLYRPIIVVDEDDSYCTSKEDILYQSPVRDYKLFNVEEISKMRFNKIKNNGATIVEIKHDDMPF